MIQAGLSFFPAKKEQLQNALEMAEQIVGKKQINSITEAVDLLKENGVEPNFLGKVEQLAEHPIANTFYNMTGMKKEDILKDLNRLKNGFNASGGANRIEYTPQGGRTPTVDKLAIFKAGLKQFKK